MPNYSSKMIDQSPEHNRLCLDHQNAVDKLTGEIDAAQLEVIRWSRNVDAIDRDIQELEAEGRRISSLIPTTSGSDRTGPRDRPRGPIGAIAEILALQSRLADIRREIEGMSAGRARAARNLQESVRTREQLVEERRPAQSAAGQDGCLTVIGGRR